MFKLFGKKALLIATFATCVFQVSAEVQSNVCVSKKHLKTHSSCGLKEIVCPHLCEEKGLVSNGDLAQGDAFLRLFGCDTSKYAAVCLCEQRRR